ncbi:ABC transporter ATP-binding protein [uncultured Anaerococcus sp.]|uniref:ABC transporter ATP-binding protein n=1 Tax=uncultured Anaerococcus sp. TaxID=293428 RepID=UPI00288C1ED2|nr:ABC transporter ATP-binding protein [uncultured Anaerococcus sp.]
MNKQNVKKLYKDPEIVNKKEVFKLVIGYVISSLALLAIPISTKILVDAISKKEELGFDKISLIFLAVIFSSLLIFYFGSYKVKKANLKFYENLVNKIYTKSVAMYPSDYETFDAGFIHNLYYGESQTLAANLTNLFIIMPASLIQALIFASVLMNIDIKLSLLVLVSLPLYIFLVSFNAKKRTDLNQETIVTNDLFVKTTNNFKDNISQIKLSGARHFFEDKFKKATSDNRKSHERFYFYYFLGERLSSLVTSILPIIILAFGAKDVINNRISLGTILMFIEIAAFLFEPLTNFFHILTEAKSIKPYLERFESFAYKISEENKLYDEMFTPTKDLAIKNSKVFSQTSDFLYDVDMDLKENGLYIIKGKNGSGKSTLLRLLSGLNSAKGFEGGKVSIPRSYKDNIAFLFYPLFNFEGTGRENIIFNEDMDIRFSELLEDDVYNKNIKINPLNLSSGQAQKISLLRVLNSEKKVIFLDEPTTNLERESIEKLKKYLEAIKKEKLVIIIMHSDEYDEIADGIYKIGDDKKLIIEM